MTDSEKQERETTDGRYHRPHCPECETVPSPRINIEDNVIQFWCPPCGETIAEADVRFADVDV
jgi:predicted RNA-binding Zn-ribbon protein involved in translation (DUF1610 family)